MKNILLINWRDIKNPEAGGAETYYHEIFKRIAANGFTITLIAHRFKGAPSMEIIDGITVIRRGSKFLFNFEIVPFLLKNRYRFDIVIEDLNKIPFFTPLYLKPPRIHLAMHFFGSDIFKEALFPAALYVFLMEKLASLVYRNEKFVAISESTAHDLQRFPVSRENIRIVEPGIDTSFYKPVGEKANPPVIAHVGRLMKYKNVQFVITCLPLLLDAIPMLTLEIGGHGDFSGALMSLSIKLGIANQVKFLGRITEDDKRSLLSKAILFVNPSSKEGWGINTIEANLCGTVSLSSDVHGLRDSVIDGVTGLLYKPDNKPDFCDKALRLLSNTAQRTSMEIAARQRAQKLDWNTISVKMQHALGVTLQSARQK